VLAACHERGLTPIVTYWHFTSPRWFAGLGGWENAANADHFVRYCERAAKHLGDLTGAAATFNEPNIPALLKWVFARLPKNPFEGAQGMMDAAAKAVGADRFSFFLTGNADAQRDAMLPAHHRAVAAIKSGPGKYPVGVTLAIADEQAVGPDSVRDAKREQLYGPWLDAASKSDFVGVQTYTRARVGKDGDLPPDPAAELTQMGYEFYPEALEQTIRYAAGRAKVPCMSPRMAWPPTTTLGAWSTSSGPWRASSSASRTASTSAVTSIGRCWTTSSGCSATGHGSGW